MRRSRFCFFLDRLRECSFPSLASLSSPRLRLFSSPRQFESMYFGSFSVPVGRFDRMGPRKGKRERNKVERRSLDYQVLRRAKKTRGNEKNGFLFSLRLLAPHSLRAFSAPRASQGGNSEMPSSRVEERKRGGDQSVRESESEREREQKGVEELQRQRRSRREGGKKKLLPFFFSPDHFLTFSLSLPLSLPLSPSVSLPLSPPLSPSLSHSLFKNPKTTQQQRHLHGARHFPHRHLGARHAAPGRLQDHRRRQQREGRPGSPQRRPEAPRSAHHDRRGRRLRRQRHVRRRARPRSRQRVPDRVPALLRGHHRHLPRRAAAEGLRPRLGHLAVHRDQHLREHHLEGLQPLHRHRRARVRVRGGRDRAVPPAADAR